jgi:photosystem II stability/assembly factor-like uncharacterized protein
MFSIDTAKSWNHASSKIPDSMVSSIVSSNKNIFLSSYGSGIFLSTDNGASWNPVNSGLTNLHVSSLYINGNSIFAGTYDDKVFVSANSGVSWTPITNGFADKAISALAMKGNSLFVGTQGGGLLVTNNLGVSWDTVNIGIKNKNINAIALIDSNIFVGTDFGVYESDNNGLTWKAVNSGLENSTIILSIAANDGNLIIGTNYNGIWRRPLSEMVGVKHKSPSIQIPISSKIGRTEYSMINGRKLTFRSGRIALPFEGVVIESNFYANGRVLHSRKIVVK